MQIDALGERIRDARTRLGLTQTNVADALQVSAQAVSKWERGENAPDIAIVPDLAQLLGVTTDRLLGMTAPIGPTAYASVVFTDMRGFTTRVRDMAPGDVATLVNAHFYQVTEVMLRYDAIPVKYIGDSSLSFFAGPRHEERALLAALHAKTLVSESLSIGVSSGDVYIGRIGHPQHATFDVIGDTVNHASFAEYHASRSGNVVVATAATVEPVSNRFRTSMLQLDTQTRGPAIDLYVVEGEID